MKLTLNKFFLSKRSARNTVAVAYAFSILVFLGGMKIYYEYTKYGYFSTRGMHISGNDALITVVATIAFSVVFFLFAIYATIMYLFFTNRGDFTKLPTRPDVKLLSPRMRPSVLYVPNAVEVSKMRKDSMKDTRNLKKLLTNRCSQSPPRGSG
jgi:hypothetical protein